MTDDYDDTYGEGPQEPPREVEPERGWTDMGEPPREVEPEVDPCPACGNTTTVFVWIGMDSIGEYCDNCGRKDWDSEGLEAR